MISHTNPVSGVLKLAHLERLLLVDLDYIVLTLDFCEEPSDVCFPSHAARAAVLHKISQRIQQLKSLKLTRV